MAFSQKDKNFLIEGCVRGLDVLISSATPRSGSTLIQRIFNARKKTLIWGENGGCLTEFSRIYNNALQNSKECKDVRESFFNDGQDPNQWIACMTPEETKIKETIVQTVKDFHYRLYIEGQKDKFDLFGCKEVKYGKEELQLFRECFPECLVMLLVRHPVDVWKSISRRTRLEQYGSPEAFCRLWKERVEEYLNLASIDSKMHFIKYEDVVEGHPDVMNLIKDIGHLNETEIKNVLDVKISSTSKRTPPREMASIKTICEPLMKDLGYK